MILGVDYYPEHWEEERWPVDARLMQEAGITVVRLGEFAWSKLEPLEGHFEFGWLDRALDVLASRGIRAVLGTPTAAPPAWLIEKHPDVLPLDGERHVLGFGARLHRCLGNPAFRQCSRAITAAMAEHYASHPAVIGWQTDNEFMGNRCYCDVCAESFRHWLQRRHGSLDALNRAWGTAFWSQEYSAWAQVPLPWRTPCGSMAHSPSLLLDYYRFASDTTVEFQREQVQILRTHCPRHFVTHNFMGLHDSVDYYDLAADLDFVSWDNYPSGSAALPHDVMRGVLRKNMWIMEERCGHIGWNTFSPAPRPGQVRGWAWQAIGHGADAVVFFRWRSCRSGTEQFWQGILNHDAVPGRRYREIAQFGQELKRLDAEFDGTRPRNEAAILYSYEQIWALQIQPQVQGFSFGVFLDRYHAALRRLGVNADVISTEADFKGYKLLICPPLYLLGDALAERLERFVAAGGYLIVSPRTGVKDENNIAREEPLPGPLAAVLGAVVEEYDAIGDGSTAIELQDGARFNAGLWCDVLRLQGAQPAGKYLRDFYAGSPAISVHDHGEGRAWYVGTAPEERFYRHFLLPIVERLRLRRVPDLPKGVEVACREGKKGRILVFTNLTGQKQIVRLADPCEDLFARTILTEPVELEPYGVRLLRTTR